MPESVSCAIRCNSGGLPTQRTADCCVCQWALACKPPVTRLPPCCLATGTKARRLWVFVCWGTPKRLGAFGVASTHMGYHRQKRSPEHRGERLLPHKSKPRLRRGDYWWGFLLSSLALLSNFDCFSAFTKSSHRRLHGSQPRAPPKNQSKRDQKQFKRAELANHTDGWMDTYMFDFTARIVRLFTQSLRGGEGVLPNFLQAIIQKCWHKIEEKALGRSPS